MQKNIDPGGVVVLVATIIAVFDAVIKFSAVRWLPIEGSHFGISWMWIEVFHNRGAAFSTPLPMLAIILASVIIIFWLLRYSRTICRTRPLEAAFGFTVCIGAIGNLLDRFLNGSTTDYIQFNTGAAINLSDVLILFGLAGLIYTHRHIDKTSKM